MRILEHKITESELDKMFADFNAEFFDNELPSVACEIQSSMNEYGNNVAGVFVYAFEMVEQLKRTEVKYRQDYIDFCYGEDGIPKIVIDENVCNCGYFETASILLHEMCHEWVAFVLLEKSNKFGGHGASFRKKVDEINKKSNDKYAVGYTEITSAYNGNEDSDEGYGEFESKKLYLILNSDSKKIVTSKVEYPPIFFDEEHFNREYIQGIIRSFATNVSFMNPQRFNYELQALYKGFTIYEFQTNQYVGMNYFEGAFYYNSPIEKVDYWKLRDYKLSTQLKNLLKNIESKCDYTAIGHTSGDEDYIGYRIDRV